MIKTFTGFVWTALQFRRGRFEVASRLIFGLCNWRYENHDDPDHYFYPGTCCKSHSPRAVPALAWTATLKRFKRTKNSMSSRGNWSSFHLLEALYSGHGPGARRSNTRGLDHGKLQRCTVRFLYVPSLVLKLARHNKKNRSVIPEIKHPVCRFKPSKICTRVATCKLADTWNRSQTSEWCICDSCTKRWLSEWLLITGSCL